MPQRKKGKKDNRDVLKKIVDAANSFKKAPLAFVDHPYFDWRAKNSPGGIYIHDFFYGSSVKKK